MLDVFRLLTLSFGFIAVLLLMVPSGNFAVAQDSACRDVLLNFDDLAHGARLGNLVGTDPGTIHAQLAPFGIEASAQANDPDLVKGEGIDTLIIYDSHFGIPPADPDDPNNVGKDRDLEHPFNPNADPLVEGVPIIPRIDDPQGSLESVAMPDDWRKGGTVVYTFDHERILKKFTGVDDLNILLSKAVVFDNIQGTGTPLATIPIDMNDDDRGTHVYDIDDIFGVKRIDFFYPSSGGITNIDLGCVAQPVCDDLPPPDISGLSENQVLGTACVERPANCIGVTTLTLEYNGLTPATITAKDKKDVVLKTVTIDQLPGSITVTADDVPGKNKLPPNTFFTITVVDNSSVDILVADDNTDAIIKVDPATGQQTLVSNDRDFDDPENLLVDGQGRLLVAEGDFPNDKGSILEVNSDGTLSIFTSGGFFNDGPEDLVEDSFGNIYVLDDGARKVIKVSPSGNQSPFAEFNFKPEGITIDNDGNIIVVGGSGNGAKVISITPGGTKTVVSQNQLLVRPEGVAVDALGNIIVADGNANDSNAQSNTGKIIRVFPDGTQELIFTGSPLVDPSDVEIDADGVLIISDDAAEGRTGAIFRCNPNPSTCTPELISSNAISSNDFFSSPEGLFIAPLITQEDITIHTSCSQDIDPGDMHGSLTIIEICKIFDNGREQCFTTTGGPYDSLSAEQYVEVSNNDQPAQSYSRNNDDDHSYTQQHNDESYTTPPDQVSVEVEEGALAIEEGDVTPPEDIPGIVEQLPKYDALSKEHYDMLANLQQKGVKLEKRLQSLLEKYDNGKYYGPIPEGDQETKSYSLSLDGSAFPMHDSAVTDLSGEILIETLGTGTHTSKFRVTSGQLIIGDTSYDVIFGKARTTLSASGEKASMVFMAQLLDQEGNVNTLRLSFVSEMSLQDELSQPINFEIAPRSKIAHNWHLSASGQLFFLEG